MIDIKTLYSSENFLKRWKDKGGYETKHEYIKWKILNIITDIKYLQDKITFECIDDFIEYTNTILKEHNIKEEVEQFKGYIFELFCIVFLNYFKSISIHVKDKDIVETYVFQYVCLPPNDYKDYGVDSICLLNRRGMGKNKNGVIQVKFRTAKKFDIHADIMDKLLAQGTKHGFIEPITPENSKDKTLILFTSAYYNEYKRAFENNSLFENLIIIDGNTINDYINDFDLWIVFKQTIDNIIKYK